MRRAGAVAVSVSVVCALLVGGCVSGRLGTVADSSRPKGAERTAAPAAATAPVREARTAPLDDEALRHLLGRATFGPRPNDIDHLRGIGAAAWLERQLHPDRIDDTRVDRALGELRTLTMPIDALLREYPRPDPALRARLQSGEMTRREVLEMYPPEKRPGRITQELQAAKMLRAVESERQLQELMVDFWFNHFNVFAAKGEVRWSVGAYEREAIRPHALGRFRDLVRATARHPAMLFYLDQWLSARPDFVIPVGPNRGRRSGLNENYARELMELHTLGVDGGYTQKDVTEVARAFTGWTIDRRTEGRDARVSDSRFVFRPSMHDRGEKTVLGHRLPAGRGESDGEQVIEILTRHPSTARFVAGKLVRRLVADQPPPALVERVATTFRETDGDVRAMLRTIFASPEFWSAGARRAKVKKPFEFVASAVRALGGTTDATGALALARAAGEIGEPLYEAQAPTGHPDRAESWVSTAALLARMNFALDLGHGRYAGVRADPRALVDDAGRSHPDAVLDRLLAVLLPGGARAETRAVLAEHLRDPQIARPSGHDRRPPNADVPRVAALVIGSPDFQRR